MNNANIEEAFRPFIDDNYPGCSLRFEEFCGMCRFVVLRNGCEIGYTNPFHESASADKVCDELSALISCASP